MNRGLLQPNWPICHLEDFIKSPQFAFWPKPNLRVEYNYAVLSLSHSFSISFLFFSQPRQFCTYQLVMLWNIMGRISWKPLRSLLCREKGPRRLPATTNTTVLVTPKTHHSQCLGRCTDNTRPSHFPFSHVYPNEVELPHVNCTTVQYFCCLSSARNTEICLVPKKSKQNIYSGQNSMYDAVG